MFAENVFLLTIWNGFFGVQVSSKHFFFRRNSYIFCLHIYLAEVGIYKRKQESKKTRKKRIKELDQESDQENKKTTKKKEKNFFFSW